MRERVCLTATSGEIDCRAFGGQRFKRACVRAEPHACLGASPRGSQCPPARVADAEAIPRINHLDSVAGAIDRWRPRQPMNRRTTRIGALRAKPERKNRDGPTYSTANPCYARGRFPVVVCDTWYEVRTERNCRCRLRDHPSIAGGCSPLGNRAGHANERKPASRGLATSHHGLA